MHRNEVSVISQKIKWGHVFRKEGKGRGSFPSFAASHPGEKKTSQTEEEGWSWRKRENLHRKANIWEQKE